MFTAMFAGNIGMVQSTEHIIFAAESLNEYKDIIFAFVDRGENKASKEDLAKSRNLNNVCFLPVQPFNEMPNVWGSADVGLVTLLPGIAKTAFPLKTLGIMAAGRPVLALVDEGSEVWNMIERAQCGICVPPERPDLLAEAILTLYNNPEMRKKMGENAREYVVVKYHRSVISSKYESLFLQVAGHKN